MDQYRCLMLGAGHSPLERKITAPGTPPPHGVEWTSLDFNGKSNPDVVYDLNLLHGNGWPDRLPFEDERFSEIHAYEVLEHIGKQGDFKGFFREFCEYWRILKPAGFLIATVPRKGGDWDLDDPGHTRVITERTLGFLTRKLYEDLGETATSDYREFVDPCWWRRVLSDQPEDTPHAYLFCLQKEVLLD